MSEGKLLRSLLAESCLARYHRGYARSYLLTYSQIILDSWHNLGKSFKAIGVAIKAQVQRTISSLRAAISSLAGGRVRESFRHFLRALDDPTSVYDGFDDPLTNLMRKYPEVPDWWYASIILVAFAFSIILITVWKEQATPVWTIFFVLGLNIVFLIPMTYLYAISGNTSGLNVLTELVVGYALPGHPNALMLIKAFGYNVNGQADFFVSDQKMALYAKIPPRAMYRGQLVSAVITAFVAYGVVQFVDNDITGICTPDQSAKFTCTNGSLVGVTDLCHRACADSLQVYFSSSVIWGAIGPKRIFDQL